ncbi:hypothetical protein CMU86_11655 [Elizabethkingia anophelis]|nr:hypothetical protein [Elizabethkingia anophelis]
MEGKAKEAFDAFLKERLISDTLETLNDIKRIFYQVMWLDSVRIYIEISPQYDTLLKYCRGFEASIYPEGEMSVLVLDEYGDVFITRRSATEAAIKKAVEIYNVRK